MKKNTILFFGAFIMIALVCAPILSYVNRSSVEAFSLSELHPFETEKPLAAETAAGAAASIEKIEHSGLPVGEVENHPTEGAWGTVYFVPQNHRYPGTSVADSKNDSAEIAQNQIYDIIKHLHEKNGIDFIMAEGELYGTVAEEKVAELKEKISLRHEFAEQINGFRKDTAGESVDAGSEEQLLERADNFVSFLDREIALKGAPLRIKADGQDLVLYGSENHDTREECADIVRNYIYQKDQLQSCEAGSNGLTAGTSLLEKLKALQQTSGSKDLSNHSLLEDLLSGQVPNNDIAAGLETAAGGSDLVEKYKAIKEGGGAHGLGSFSAKLAELKKKYAEALKGRTAGGNTSLEALLKGGGTVDMALDSSISILKEKARAQKKEKISARLEEMETVYKKIKNGQSNTGAEQAGPSRNDNPYKAITDPNSLKKMIKESEERIQDTVIDKRNEETAENFSRALKENNEISGILQFGAGHEEGLVKELQKQGLSVIVIKADEVLRREMAE